jgi:hypothetical protein
MPLLYNQVLKLAAAEAPASPVPTTIISYFLLLAGLTSFGFKAMICPFFF